MISINHFPPVVLTGLQTGMGWTNFLILCTMYQTDNVFGCGFDPTHFDVISFPDNEREYVIDFVSLRLRVFTGQLYKYCGWILTKFSRSIHLWPLGLCPEEGHPGGFNKRTSWFQTTTVSPTVTRLRQSHTARESHFQVSTTPTMGPNCFQGAVLYIDSRAMPSILDQILHDNQTMVMWEIYYEGSRASNFWDWSVRLYNLTQNVLNFARQSSFKGGPPT